MRDLIGYLSLLLMLFTLVGPFITYYGIKKIINDEEIKKLDEYSTAALSGLFPYRKRLRWIARHYTAFPPVQRKYASRIVTIDRLTLTALATLLGIYVVSVFYIR